MRFFVSLKNGLRDSLYNIVNREGDISLQFMTDLIRGMHIKQSTQKQEHAIAREVEKREKQMEMRQIKNTSHRTRLK